MVERRMSFLRWMLRVKKGLRELLAAKGVNMAEVAPFVPPNTLFHLWRLSSPPEVVVSWVSAKIQQL